MTSQRVIRYRELSGYKYALAEAYTVELPELGNVKFAHPYFTFEYGYLTVQVNYCWDGPSGPTIDTHDAMRGSLVHDVLYQAMRLGLLDRKHRADADAIIYRLCREDGMCAIRAWTWRKSLQLFGAANVEPRVEAIELVHTAPKLDDAPARQTKPKPHFHKLR